MHPVTLSRVADAVIDCIDPGRETWWIRLAVEKIRILLAYKERGRINRIRVRRVVICDRELGAELRAQVNARRHREFNPRRLGWFHKAVVVNQNLESFRRLAGRELNSAKSADEIT